MLETKESKLYYKIEGMGPKIIFIHGWAHSRSVWSKLILKLTNNYSCISIDLPGFGHSSPINKKKVAIVDYVQELKSFIDKNFNSDEIYAIISDSLGAIITLKLIENKYLLPSKVLLSGCPVSGLPLAVKCLHRIGLIYFLLFLMKNTPYRIARYFIRKATLFTSKNPSKLSDDVIESIYKMDINSSNRILYDLTNSLDINYSELLIPSIKYCVVRGISDLLVSEDSSKSLAELLDADYFEIKDSGHTPMQENENSFLEILENFLDKK